LKKKKQYKSAPFGAMQDAAIGMAGLGVTTGAAAGIASHAPAGTPNMMGGFNTLASMTPIAVTATVGKSLLPKKNVRYFKTKKAAMAYIKKGQSQGWKGKQKLSYKGKSLGVY